MIAPLIDRDHLEGGGVKLVIGVRSLVVLLTCVWHSFWTRTSLKQVRPLVGDRDEVLNRCANEGIPICFWNEPQTQAWPSTINLINFFVCEPPARGLLFQLFSESLWFRFLGEPPIPVFFYGEPPVPIFSLEIFWFFFHHAPSQMITGRRLEV